jgi:hypothetical protein
VTYSLNATRPLAKSASLCNNAHPPKCKNERASTATSQRYSYAQLTGCRTAPCASAQLMHNKPLRADRMRWHALNAKRTAGYVSTQSTPGECSEYPHLSTQSPHVSTQSTPCECSEYAAAEHALKVNAPQVHARMRLGHADNRLHVAHLLNGPVIHL